MRDDYDDFDDYDDGDGAGWAKKGIGIATVAAVAIGAAFAFGVLPPGGGDGDDQIAFTDAPAAAAGSSDAATPRELDDEQSEPAVTEPADEPDEEPELADPDPDPGDRTDPGTSVAPVSPTVDDATDEPPADTATNQPSYPVLPDGSPVPVMGIYDGELITLSGVVPTEASADRLRTLALAFSKSPSAEVASFITIDPTIPVNVAVRVIEMNSARFPEGSPTILPEHAAELDRVVAMMTALAHVNTLVIGHSDQRGDEATNFALSTDRARTVSDYIAAQGIDPFRLSSRGAGESDLLTLNNDRAALALNRRTEFVISGLFVDPPPPVAEVETGA